MRYLVTDIQWAGRPLDVIRLPKTTQVDADCADEVIKAVEETHNGTVLSATSFPLPYATKALEARAS